MMSHEGQTGMHMALGEGLEHCAALVGHGGVFGIGLCYLRAGTFRSVSVGRFLPCYASCSFLFWLAATDSCLHV
jgi:hypothetical protein